MRGRHLFWLGARRHADVERLRLEPAGPRRRPSLRQGRPAFGHRQRCLNADPHFASQDLRVGVIFLFHTFCFYSYDIFLGIIHLWIKNQKN